MKTLPALVTIQRKGQMTLPSRLRKAIGVGEGDTLEASVQRGRIVLRPAAGIDQSIASPADDEYTPAQRRVIDARLAESGRELNRGDTFGPFDTADEMIAHMKGQLRKRAAPGKTKRAR